MTHTVTPMHCGTFSLDMDILALGVDPGTEVAAPSISYLVEGPSAVEPLLVDTSFGDVNREAERWRSGARIISRVASWRASTACSRRLRSVNASTTDIHR